MFTEMMTWIWIEGKKALDEFCLRRFKETPRFTETVGHIGGKAKVRLIYKYVYDDNGEIDRCAEMYLLYMDAPYSSKAPNLDVWSNLTEIQRKTYEEIRLDKTAILKR